MGLKELPTAAARADEPKAPQEVVDIVQLRCMMCHAPAPIEEIGEAPKGVLLDTPEHIARFAPGDPHAGGADPRDAAQQFHRR